MGIKLAQGHKSLRVEDIFFTIFFILPEACRVQNFINTVSTGLEKVRKFQQYFQKVWLKKKKGTQKIFSFNFSSALS